jgi:hypothetical protein
MHVRPVESRGADLDENLARAGLRIGVLGDHEVAVDDRHCLHGRGSSRILGKNNVYLKPVSGVFVLFRL